jgi:hypothetical protein
MKREVGSYYDPPEDEQIETTKAEDSFTEKFFEEVYNGIKNNDRCSNKISKFKKARNNNRI